VTGLTLVLVPVTVPTPWLIERDVAPVTLHPKSEEPPAVMVEGVAVKEDIVGTAAALTVTVALAVALPAEFVALRV
jgi:hypothetical protein